MLKLIGILLLCASFYLWQRKPIHVPLFGGWLASKFYLGRLLALAVFISAMMTIFMS